MDIAAGAFDKDRFMNGRIATVQILDKLNQTPFIIEFIFLIIAFVFNRDAHPFIEKSQFAQPLDQNVVTVFGRGKNFLVRLEIDLGAPFVGGSHDL